MSNADVVFSTINGDRDLDCPVGGEQQFDFACPNNKGRRCGGLLIAGTTTIKHDPQQREWWSRALAMGWQSH